MKAVFLELLRKEKPSSVASVMSATYRDLSQVRAVYFKDEACCVSEAYYTPTWIAPTPAGPFLRRNGIYQHVMDLSSLSAVAETYMLASAKEIRMLCGLSEDRLRNVYDFLDTGANMLMQRILDANSGILHSVTFSFTPEPLILCTLKHPSLGSDSVEKTASGVVFTAAIDMNWNLSSTSYVRGLDGPIDEILGLLSKAVRNYSTDSVYKEIISG